MNWQSLALRIARRLSRSKLQLSSPCAALLKSCWQHSPNNQQQVYLAVDLETSSLSIADGEILSAGWVALNSNQITLSSAEHHLVSAQNTVGQSAAIHHLRDCDLEQANHAQDMLAALLTAARGRTLLFHNASLDMAFLNQLCRRICGTDLLLPYEDTLLKEKQKLARQGKVIAPGDLTLAECRNRYHLPYYPGHNALNDALATAELFAAMQISAERVTPPKTNTRPKA